MAVQGLFQWPGAKAILTGTYTNIQGVTPGSATLYCPPQDVRQLKNSGDLRISYGTVDFSVRDCKLDRVEFTKANSDSPMVMVLHILDRRWKWKECPGAISGYYNQRQSDGDTEFIAGTQKTPRELAKMLLEAMGESGFDVSQLPNGARPVIEWDYANPARELEKLCADLGCVPCLNLARNVVVIHRVGEGRNLPEDGNPPGPRVLEYGITIDPPERPDEIVAVGQHTRIQMDLELEAVAMDKDGTIDKIDNMSYNPNGKGKKGGWENIDIPFFNGVAVKDLPLRDKIKQSLFRWYRVAVPFQLPAIPGFNDGKPYTVRNLAMILPLFTTQIEKTDGKNVPDPATASGSLFEKNVEIAAGKTIVFKQELPAWVYGIWFDVHERGQNSTTKIDPSISHKDSVDDQKKKGLYPHGFTIDADSGIVMFSDYVWMEVDKGGKPTQTPKLDNKIRPARLVLRTSFGIRIPPGNPSELGWHRYERRRRNSGQKFNTMPRYETFEDFGLTVIAYHSANLASITGTKTNEHNCIDAAEHYLDRMAAEYDLKDPRGITYAGFLPPTQLDVDGAISQVTWWIDGEGFARCRASRNREDLDLGPPYKERRLLQALQQAAQQSSKTSGAKALAQKKGKVKTA